jgi:hypothetical protein
MKMLIDNRDDGAPQLHLEAETDSDKDALERLNVEIQSALKAARKAKVAGDFNACGSVRDPDHRMDSMSIGLLLGVHPCDLPLLRDGGFSKV